ncbi:hypothetical protein HY797_00640 [Candidatus Falkowbacteria bacterium]|nr:hypothetical protein [Candidatus Falkowbacteria bacterium]
MFMGSLIQKNFDLTPFTTFRIGGRAEFFMIIKNKKELMEAIAWAKAKKLPLAILAGGSNILIVKKKIKGLVLKISGEHYTINKNYITCWTGTSLTKLLIKKKFIKLNNRACGFSYHSSVFKKRNNLLIVGVKLKLAKGVIEEIKDLGQKNFNHRFKSKPKEPSAGCVFKNLEYKKAIKQNRKLAESLMAKGLIRGGKISVGYLIDQIGLKGKTVGGAKISKKHANFIVNTGKAEAKDVVKLINFIKIKIKQKYKINLEEEIQYF